MLLAQALPGTVCCCQAHCSNSKKCKSTSLVLPKVDPNDRVCLCQWLTVKQTSSIARHSLSFCQIQVCVLEGVPWLVCSCSRHHQLKICHEFPLLTSMSSVDHHQQPGKALHKNNATENHTQYNKFQTKQQQLN